MSQPLTFCWPSRFLMVLAASHARLGIAGLAVWDLPALQWYFCKAPLHVGLVRLWGACKQGDPSDHAKHHRRLCLIRCAGNNDLHAQANRAHRCVQLMETPSLLGACSRRLDRAVRLFSYQAKTLLNLRSLGNFKTLVSDINIRWSIIVIELKIVSCLPASASIKNPVHQFINQSLILNARIF